MPGAVYGGGDPWARRALGETMAVTMLIGNRHEISASLFAPGHNGRRGSPNEFPRPPRDITWATRLTTCARYRALRHHLVINGIATGS